MFTWGTLKQEVETLLGSLTTWTDQELMLYANYAIRQYSEDFPRERAITLDTDGTTQSWDLPSDFLKARYVECPDDTFLEEIQIKPGTEYYSSTLPNMWYVEGDKLYLTAVPDANDTLTLHYAASHTEFSDSDDETTVPNRDRELIALYTAMRAVMRVMLDQSRLDRFKSKMLDSGNPEQNPLVPTYRILEREYWRKYYDRLPVGNIYLHKKGRGA